jgi:mRNA interferase MazF
MRRGAIVIVSARGDYGKPRPAVIIQATRMLGVVDSITVCFLTSDITLEGPLRISIQPEARNGLQLVSQVQVEKIMTFPSEKVRGPIGDLTEAEMAAVDQGLLFFLSLIQPLSLPVLRSTTEDPA